MKTPHKHAELIKAWADGAEIQLKMNAVQWGDCVDPYWNPDLEYRIKPEPRPDLTLFYWVSNHIVQSSSKVHIHNLTLTFDGMTGALKSAEVLQ